MSDWIGKTLGKVRIDLLLARGGMAEVYLGMHTTLQRPVAVKLLRHPYLDEPDLLARFQREARVVAMLRHPNIVQVFDFDTYEGQPFLVMEYVPGMPLSNYLHDLHERSQVMEYPMVSRLVAIIAHALQYAHENGVIHRDVKPGNILLNSRSQPVEAGKPLPLDVQPFLTDFGLVRIVDAASHTRTGEIAGTPAYMSPEQARGDPTDSRTDIYSLGIVLYELLAGRVPFEADSTMGVLMKQISEPPAPIPGLHPAVQQVIDRALAKLPADRFQTPLELARALEAALQKITDSPTIMPSASMQARDPAPRALPRIDALPVFLGVGLLALAVALIWLGRPAPPTAVPTLTASAPAQTAEQASPSPQVQAPTVVPPGHPLALLRFQDGAALVDEVTVTAMGLPLPPQGQQYEAWLVGQSTESRRSIGVLALDTEGKGQLSFVDEQGRNLLERYDTLELTLEPAPDSNPNPSDSIAYRLTLPADALLHVRHLLVAFPATPANNGLVTGLLKASTQLDALAQDMLAAQANGDAAALRRDAESMLNLLVGGQSEDHRDWDNDGAILDPGDGFGLLLNGDSPGYIEGSTDHAGYAASAPDATQNMIVHGAHVEVCAQNLEQWSPQLRDLLKQILQAQVGPESEPLVRQAVALADEILEGTDLNGNEQIEPLPGEGGARTAYQHAYYMADITILSGP